MAVEIIRFPDIEKLLCKYLTNMLALTDQAGVKAGTKVPVKRPRAFVRVLRTGGARQNVIYDRAQITVEAYADDEVTAEDIAQLCRGFIHRIDQVDDVQFYRVDEFAAPANFPDPLTSQTRYIATYQIGVRGKQISL
ncbi:hypothetical protein [Psychromicrobium lacuslunae]|uniref:hypothetical protein n=1 Tax=Psychromicrobium lacuslunae TaxID=1618207 RepID=UPI0005D3BB40|nr:hypothetical protein [Psychromicrobium lacuslunae]